MALLHARIQALMQEKEVPVRSVGHGGAHARKFLFRQARLRPVYLSPEAFLRMAGQDAPLGPKLDTFAFGALIHRVWTGELPSFDHQKYTYLYEAALAGGDIALSSGLPAELRDAVLRMLDPKPENRPEDGELTNLLAIAPEDSHQEEARPVNGLSRFMKPTP